MRKRLTYANVAATLALVFSMTGGALAASHYLITSTKQISPKVIKKLKGATGKTGAAGTTGKEGPPGKEGAPGKEGPKGVEGSPLATLPSGQSESGEFDIRANGKSGSRLDESIDYRTPLAAPIAAANVVHTEVEGSAQPHCSGPGHADPGYLCIYGGFVVSTTELAVFNYETSKYVEGSGRNGFDLEWRLTAEGGYEAGNWTVTAP